MQRCQKHKAGHWGKWGLQGMWEGQGRKVTEYDSCDISENSDDLVERMVREEFCREGTSKNK